MKTFHLQFETQFLKCRQHSTSMLFKLLSRSAVQIKVKTYRSVRTPIDLLGRKKCAIEQVVLWIAISINNISSNDMPSAFIFNEINWIHAAMWPKIPHDTVAVQKCHYISIGIPVCECFMFIMGFSIIPEKGVFIFMVVPGLGPIGRWDFPA